MPLILYNLYLDLKLYVGLALAFFLIDFSLFNLIIAVISVYMSARSQEYQDFVEDNKMIRDNLKEDAIYLKKYNEQLKLDREKNIHIAILTERNRIARELHDSIGHTLSSSILQVEALKLSSDESTIKGLNLLQGSLNDGMNDIRDSIHNLHKESFDLETKIEDLLEDLQHIDSKLNYRIDEDLSYQLKFDILSIVREAITNCLKHSNAKELRLSLFSQPRFYTIVIEDDGSKYEESKEHDGIGLMTMNEIAMKYNGFMNYSFEKGFKIHISLMKG